MSDRLGQTGLTDTSISNSAIGAFIDWTVERALPLWATAGYDAAAGRFRERLDFAGQPLDVPHRAMVQARQIYVFSQAAALGWYAGGDALAEAAMASLLRELCTETGNEASFAFSVRPDGSLASSTRDTYTHAFVLFALASLFEQNGDRRLLTIADKTITFLENKLTDRRMGGLFDADPKPSGDKRQNPVMHLLEAYLALERCAPGRGYLERARALIELFATRLFQQSRGVLLEHFAEDWSSHPDRARAQLFEPGHHFEWVWLLGEYERLSGEPAERWTTRLYDVACGHGLSSAGRIFDEVSSDMQVIKRSHRLWPHTEAIKAASARVAMGARAPDNASADAMASTLLSDFLDRPFEGGWIDHLDEHGEPLVGFVPASSLYHIVLAAAVAAPTLQPPTSVAVQSLRRSSTPGKPYSGSRRPQPNCSPAARKL